MSFYDPNEEIPETGEFAPLPEGSYTLFVEGAEYGKTKSGDGEKLVVTFVVQDPPYLGRKVWQTFNIVNKSTTAQNIGRAQRKQFLDVVGVTKKLESFEDFKKATLGRTVVGELEVDGKYNRVAEFAPATVVSDEIPF